MLFSPPRIHLYYCTISTCSFLTRAFCSFYRLQVGPRKLGQRLAWRSAQRLGRMASLRSLTQHYKGPEPRRGTPALWPHGSCDEGAHHREPTAGLASTSEILKTKTNADSVGKEVEPSLQIASMLNIPSAEPSISTLLKPGCPQSIRRDPG